MLLKMSVMHADLDFCVTLGDDGTSMLGAPDCQTAHPIMLLEINSLSKIGLRRRVVRSDVDFCVTLGAWRVRHALMP